MRVIATSIRRLETDQMIGETSNIKLSEVCRQHRLSIGMLLINWME